MRRVRLLRLPVQTWRAAAAHQEAIRRELDIIRSGLPNGAVPNRLFALIGELDARFGGLNQEAADRLMAAADEGRDAIDVVYEVPVEAAEAAERLGEMLDEVDEFCRQGDQLMSLATPPELVEFREWFLTEFIRQLRGEPPTPWPADPGHDTDRAEPASGWSVRADGADAVVEVDTDLDLATAPALRDVLQDLVNRGVRDVTIDLRRGVFLDSLGLSLFVTAHDRLAAAGGRLRLIVGDRLLALFQAAELTGTLEIELRPG